MKINKKTWLLLFSLIWTVGAVAQVDGNTMKYGNHTYTTDGKSSSERAYTARQP